MTDAYAILQNTELSEPIDEAYFHQLIKDFQASFLTCKNLYERIDKHRYPDQVKNEVLDELYKYLHVIQYRPEMQDIDEAKKTGGYVPTKINEIWRSDKTLKSLYNAVKIYVELRKKDFNTIAIHVAEYRAMNKLIPIIKRSVRKNKPVREVPNLTNNNKAMSNLAPGKIGFSSRFYEPLRILIGRVDANHVFKAVYNEDRETYSSPYLYENYINDIEPVTTSDKIVNSVKKYFADNLYNKDEIKLLLADLMPYITTFGDRTIKYLTERMDVSTEVTNQHLGYFSECEKTIKSLYLIRELVSSELTAYYTSVVSGKTLEKNNRPTIESPVEIYKDILKIFTEYGRDLETKPRVFTGQTEEGLRDHFLTNLTGRYAKTTATGETFNKGGKTDILLKDHFGNNLFIAECKWWNGASGFQAAISQLFDNYISWRDTNLAILFFVDNKDFSNVLSQAEEEARKHPYFIQFTSQNNDTNFSFIFRQKDDVQKQVLLEIMLFHFLS